MGPRGTASGSSSIVSPATGALCLAFSLELHYVGPGGGDRVLYRDSVTCGFDVALEAGGMARIPSGRIQLLGSSRQVIDFDNLEIEEYLRNVDRRHEPGGRFDPLQYSVIFEQCLLPSDRVELASRFEPRVARTNREGNYRDPAVSHLAPVGIPIVRRLSGG
jgi:hypothetical protein